MPDPDPAPLPHAAYATLLDVLDAMVPNARRVALAAARAGDDPADLDAALARETDAILAGLPPDRPVLRAAVARVGALTRDLAGAALAPNSGTRPPDPAAALDAAFDQLAAWLDAGGRDRILSAGDTSPDGHSR